MATAQADILVTTEESPPYNTMIDGKIGGVATGIVKAMFRQAGVGYTIHLLPWERAYEMALRDKDTCVYSTAVNEERMPLFEWVGPLVVTEWVLFAKADRNITIKTLADAKPYKIGGYFGDAVANYLKKRGFTVDEAPRDGLNIPKLQNDRIDLWATGSQSGPILMKEAMVNDIKMVFSFRKNVLSMACNKGTDLAVLTKLRAALMRIAPVQ